MTAPISQSVDSLSGRTSTGPFITIIKDRAPTTSDGTAQGYLVGQRWVDTSDDNHEYFLLNFSASNGVISANWIVIASGSATTETLTGNTGQVVSPDGAQNINVVGSTATGITFNGVSATNTLTASLASIPNSSLTNSSITLVAGTGISITTSPVSLGASTTISSTSSVATAYVTNSGTATPAANSLNVLGSGGVTTSGSGSTVTVTAGTTIPTAFATDSGTATPASNSLTVAGASGITTSGSGHTVTVTAGVTIPTSFATDSGTATPASHSVTFHGTSGVTTSGSGSTVTITGSAVASATSFSAYLSTDKTNVTGDGTNYQIPFDTALVNNGAAYNTTTGAFTAPATGLYQFNANARFQTANHTDTLKQDFLWNSTYYRTCEISSSAGVAETNGSFMANMTSGDTMAVVVDQVGGAKTVNITGPSAGEIMTMFSGYRIA